MTTNLTIANVTVPRKRRIYDVLHVLEGIIVLHWFSNSDCSTINNRLLIVAIGAIKRVRFNDAKGRKGGFFLYYGRDAAIRRLRSIRKESFQIASELKLACQKSPSTQDIDISTIEYFEDQAEAEKWPSLTTTTICFLGLLLQRDHKNAIPVPSISHRMIEAKQALELITDGDISNAHVDVNRRVYDVVSVLASCNVLLMSVTANSHGLQYDEIDKISLRKHVRFNHEIFTDHSSLKIANVTLNQLAEMNQDRHKSTGPRTRLREKQPQEDENEIARISEAESLLTLKSSSGGIAFQSLTTLASPAEEESKIKLPTTPTGRSGVASENVVDPDITQFEPLFWNLKPCGLEDLFSPLHYECENDWYQDFLHDIIFHDCLSSQYRMHWEMLSSLDQDTNYVWGADATAASSLIRPDYTDHELATIDLECHEILDEVLDEDYLL